MQLIKNALHLKMKRRTSCLLLRTVYAHLACVLYVIHSRKYAQLAEMCQAGLSSLTLTRISTSSHAHTQHMVFLTLEKK